MVYDVKRIDSYRLIVADPVAAGSRLLSAFAGVGVDLLAFRAVPLPTGGTRFTLVPTEGSRMAEGAKKADVKLDGPHPALLVRGEEKPGACAGIFEKLSGAEIPIREASGIAHINGGYGVILHLEPKDCDKAAALLSRS